MQYNSVFYLCSLRKDIHHKTGTPQTSNYFEKYFTCPLTAVNAVIGSRNSIKTNRYIECSRKPYGFINYDNEKNNHNYPTIFSIPQSPNNPKNTYLVTKAELRENGIQVEFVGASSFWPNKAKNAFFNYQATTNRNEIDLKECLKVEYHPPKIKMIANYEYHYNDGTPIKYWFDVISTDRPPDKKKYGLEGTKIKKIVLHSVVKVKTSETRYSFAV